MWWLQVASGAEAARQAHGAGSVGGLPACCWWGCSANLPTHTRSKEHSRRKDRSGPKPPTHPPGLAQQACSSRLQCSAPSVPVAGPAARPAAGPLFPPVPPGASASSRSTPRDSQGKPQPAAVNCKSNSIDEQYFEYIFLL